MSVSAEVSSWESTSVPTIFLAWSSSTQLASEEHVVAQNFIITFSCLPKFHVKLIIDEKFFWGGLHIDMLLAAFMLTCPYSTLFLGYRELLLKPFSHPKCWGWAFLCRLDQITVVGPFIFFQAFSPKRVADFDTKGYTGFLRRESLLHIAWIFFQTTTWDSTLSLCEGV